MSEKIKREILESGIIQRIERNKGKGIVIKGHTGTGKSYFAENLSEVLMGANFINAGEFNYKTSSEILPELEKFSEIVQSQADLSDYYVVIDDFNQNTAALLLEMVFIPIMKSKKLNIIFVNQMVKNERLRDCLQNWLFPISITCSRENGVNMIEMQYSEIITKKLYT